MAEVYRPAVESSPASFELVPPSPDEMAERVREALGWAPWLVAEVDRRVIGYAYGGRHRERAAYRWSIEVSAYIHPTWQGRGVGQRLYTTLFEALRAQRFVNVYASVTTPNDASLALHARFGLEPIGVFRDIGYKFGAWHDVAWFGARLQEPADPPAEPIPLPDFLPSPAGQSWLVRLANDSKD